MAWAQSTTTKHTCGGPVFGKRTPGCPRCDELTAGAQPVRWDWAERKRADEERRRAEMAAHYAPGGRHARGLCGPVCTAFDW
jgi:hypothetical protein